MDEETILSDGFEPSDNSQEENSPTIFYRTVFKYIFPRLNARNDGKPKKFEILSYTTNDVNLLVVTLIEAKGLFFLRSFILVPRIQDDATPTVIPFLNIY